MPIIGTTPTITDLVDGNTVISAIAKAPHDELLAYIATLDVHHDSALTHTGALTVTGDVIVEVDLVLEDQDATPVDDLILKVVDGVMQVRDSTDTSFAILAGVLNADTVNEIASGVGVTIDGFNLKDSAPGPTSWPSFKARLSTSQNITSASPTKVEFDTEEFDTNSDYDNSTNYRFTPTAAGKYLIIMNLNLSGCDTGYFYCEIRKNGSAIQRSTDRTATIERSFSVAVIMDMNGSTDYLEGFIASETDTDYYSTGGDNYLSIFTASRIA